jgi:putative peptidoglycan lipid II flippase
VTTSVEELAVSSDEPKERPTGGAAAIIAGSILVSRLFGIVRQSLIAAYLGASGVGDAFAASFRISNIIQNLFGEGVLSASFIPVYARLVASGDDEEAGRVAGAVGALLCLAVAVFVLVAIWATPLLIPFIAPGFKGPRRELTIQLTRILFPGAGIFVISAWCLGILNSHRKFFLPYFAPVLWNVVMIGTLLWGGPRRGETDLVVLLAWASVAGAALQFLVQLPTTLTLVRRLRISLDARSPNVRLATRNFGPVFVSRGVVQISSYIDTLLASLLPFGMVATFFYGSQVALLPVSLFGMSISAATLPEMSSALGTQSEIAAKLRAFLDRGLRHIAYFVIPSAAGFLAFGDVISRVLFEYKRFTAQDSTYVWGILAGAAVGLLASTMGRLYSSTYYALNDTRTPLRFATVRVVLTTALGYFFALPLPRLLHIDPHWGAAGLTTSAGIAGWVEFSLLRSRLNIRIGETGVAARFIVSLWGCAAVAALAGWGVRMLVAGHNHFFGGLLVLASFAAAYLATTIAIGIPEARAVLARVSTSRGNRTRP